MMTLLSANWKAFLRKHFWSFIRIGGLLLFALLLPYWPVTAYCLLVLNVGLLAFSYVITPFAQLPSLWLLPRSVSSSSNDSTHRQHNHLYQQQQQQQQQQQFASWGISSGLSPSSTTASASGANATTGEDDASCSVCGGDSCQRHRADLDPTFIQPWLGLLIHERVDKALEEIGDLLLQDSVYPWLKDISVDEDFVDELRSVLRHVTAGVYRRVVKTDWSPFILTDLIREGVRHVHYFLEARAKSVNAHNNNPPSSFLSSPSPSRACGAGAQVPIFVNSSPARDVQLTALSCLGSYMHVAVRSRESEVKYLSNLVDALLPILLPRAAKENQCVNALLREILVMKCLLPVIDALADPDILNYIAIVILDKDPPPVFTGEPSQKTTIMSNYAQPRRQQPCITSLRYRLDDVLEDPNLLYHFMQFLKSEASVHVLQFCKTLQEFNNFLLNPDLDSSALTALHREATSLYTTFIGRQASNRILFDDDIIEEVERVVNGPAEDVVRLRKTNALFRAYEHAATDLLENTFLPLFYQSDDYFRMLCGDRQRPIASSSSFSSSSSSRHSKSLSRAVNGIDGNHHLGTSSSSSLKPSPSVSKIGSKIKGVFKTVADEVDFNDTVDGVARVGNVGGDDDDVDEMFDDGEDVVEVVGAAFGEGMPSCASQDLSTWRVTIPSVAETPSEDSSKSECILNIEVHRVDCSQDDTIPQHWEIGRRYHEFYVLQSKLAEFHGEFGDDCRLPPKKTFATKDLEFIEKSRLEFEMFLQRLLLKPTLKNSQLLQAFLSVDVEGNPFSSSFFPSMNIGKVFRKVPSKLIKEKGQHLDAFLQSFAHSTEQEPPQVVTARVNGASRASSVEPPKLASASSSSSIPSLKDHSRRDSAGPESLFPAPVLSALLRQSLFNNLADIPDYNFPSTPMRLRSAHVIDNAARRADSNAADAIVNEPHSVVDFLLFVCQCVFRLPSWLQRLVHGVDLLLRNTLESFLVWFLAWKLEQIFEEQRLEDIVHDVRDILFFDEDPPRSDKQKKLRKDQLFKDMIHFLPPWLCFVLGKERVYHGFKIVFDCLQQPVLNKQLVYCLLDVAVAQVFPELRHQFGDDEVVDL